MQRFSTVFTIMMLGAGPLMALHSPEPGMIDIELRASAFSKVPAPSDNLAIMAQSLSEDETSGG